MEDLGNSGFNTAATDALCSEIAKKSKGVCFLGFSRGKDSLCAWLQLRRYFKRIIPFHCASIPGLRFVKETLDYYEWEFQTHILRLMGEDLPMAMGRLIYQEPWDVPATVEQFGGVENYTKLDILEYLRMRFNLPRAWCAFGISMNDSIDRLIYCRQNGGKNDSNKTFYPCYDWTRKDLVNAIRESGLKVSSEYRYTKRSIGGVPSATYNAVMKKHYPEDFMKLLKWYPLAEAKNYREDMLERNILSAREATIAANGGKIEGSDGGDGESESGGEEE